MLIGWRPDDGDRAGRRRKMLIGWRPGDAPLPVACILQGTARTRRSSAGQRAQPLRWESRHGHGPCQQRAGRVPGDSSRPRAGRVPGDSSRPRAGRVPGDSSSHPARHSHPRPSRATGQQSANALPLSLSLRQGFDDQCLGCVASHLRPATFAGGEAVYERGDRGDEMYLVVDGAVVLRTRFTAAPSTDPQAQQQQQQLAGSAGEGGDSGAAAKAAGGKGERLVGKGDVFGEAGLFPGELGPCRRESVTTLSRVSVYVLNAAALQEIEDEYPEVRLRHSRVCWGPQAAESALRRKGCGRLRAGSGIERTDSLYRAPSRACRYLEVPRVTKPPPPDPLPRVRSWFDCGSSRPCARWRRPPTHEATRPSRQSRRRLRSAGRAGSRASCGCGLPRSRPAAAAFLSSIPQAICRSRSPDLPLGAQ